MTRQSIINGEMTITGFCPGDAVVIERQIGTQGLAMRRYQLRVSDVMGETLFIKGHELVPLEAKTLTVRIELTGKETRKLQPRAKYAYSLEVIQDSNGKIHEAEFGFIIAAPDRDDPRSPFMEELAHVH